MKQTNYQLFDFLDFDPDLTDEERLWKACKPVNIEQQDGDVLVTIPFQKQIPSNDITPDKNTPRKEYKLRLRAYGDRILRIGIGIGIESMPGSVMLDISPDLMITPLGFEKNDDEWLVKDISGKVKARYNRKESMLDYWSDLVPPPEETLEASFYPDSEREVRISAYDQFFPARQDAFALAYVEKKGICEKITISFYAEPNEMFAGTGERFSKMDLSGQTVQLSNADAQGVNSRRAYKNIPFYLSSRMVGTFMHTSAYGKFSFADHSTRSVQLLAEENMLDIFLIGGSSPEEILFGYRQLTGFPAILPRWSYGTWMSRMTYFSADEVSEVCKRLRGEDYPVDVIHLDTGWFKTDWLCEWKFNRERFPDPEGFIAALRKDGFKVSLWQMPYIAAEAEQYGEAVKNNYIGKRSGSGNKAGSGFSVQDYAGTIDFTRPETVQWYQGLLKNLLDMGVVCIKTDFGEDIHMDAEYHGMEPVKLRNIYALLYQKAAWEITREVTGEGIIWARAGWAGCQRYPVHWGGDAASSWDGMAGSLKGGLHLGLSGFGFWSHDVPGFHGVPDFMNAVIPGDLYVRWTQFGVFTSHLRYHGTSKREPYHFPEISDIVRKWLKLRYRLIPYLMTQGEKVAGTGYPVLRALIFHHPDDKTCWHIDDQYYFGDDFLVAPVMNSNHKRDVYLPQGKWVNLFDGRIYEGKQWLKDFEVPLDEMPVWARYGARVPVYPEKVNSTDDFDFSRNQEIVFDDSFEGIWKSCLGDIFK
jgi:alpha-D-xyloside xylohydrolase